MKTFPEGYFVPCKEMRKTFAVKRPLVEIVDQYPLKAIFHPAVFQ